MVFNIFFLTITISKRHFSKVDIERAIRAHHSDKLIERNKQRCITEQRFI